MARREWRPWKVEGRTAAMSMRGMVDLLWSVLVNSVNNLAREGRHAVRMDERVHGSEGTGRSRRDWLSKFWSGDSVGRGAILLD